jgi:predicted DNA-binding protein
MMADVIVLRPDLREALENTAEQEARTLSDLVNEAVDEYVFRLQQKKIDREVKAYERLHPDLRERFLGQWVAIHEGQLVDHDSDQRALYHRLRERFGRTSVLMKQVRESPIDEIWWRTPSTGKRPS